MGGMPRAWSVPSDNPVHRSPSEGRVQGKATASVPRSMPFLGVFQAALLGIVHRGPGNKPLRWKRQVGPAGTRQRTEHLHVLPLSSNNPGVRKELCL